MECKDSRSSAVGNICHFPGLYSFDIWSIIKTEKTPKKTWYKYISDKQFRTKRAYQNPLAKVD